MKFFQFRYFFLIVLVNLWENAAYKNTIRKCADEHCQTPIAMAKTLKKYISNNSNGWSFEANQEVYVYSHLTGNYSDYYEVGINTEDRGIVPKNHLRETRILAKHGTIEVHPNVQLNTTVNQLFENNTTTFSVNNLESNESLTHNNGQSLDSIDTNPMENSTEIIKEIEFEQPHAQIIDQDSNVDNNMVQDVVIVTEETPTLNSEDDMAATKEQSASNDNRDNVPFKPIESTVPRIPSDDVVISELLFNISEENNAEDSIPVSKNDNVVKIPFTTEHNIGSKVPSNDGSVPKPLIGMNDNTVEESKPSEADSGIKTPFKTEDITVSNDPSDDVIIPPNPVTNEEVNIINESSASEDEVPSNTDSIFKFASGFLFSRRAPESENDEESINDKLTGDTDSDETIVDGDNVKDDDALESHNSSVVTEDTEQNQDNANSRHQSESLLDILSNIEQETSIPESVTTNEKHSGNDIGYESILTDNISSIVTEGTLKNLLPDESNETMTDTPVSDILNQPPVQESVQIEEMPTETVEEVDYWSMLLERLVLLKASIDNNVIIYATTSLVSVSIILIVTIGFEPTRSKAPLIRKLQQLDRNLFLLMNERDTLAEQLSAKSTSLTDAEETMETLQNRIVALEAKQRSMDEQIHALEKELEESTEVGLELNRMLTDVLNTQNDSENVIENLRRMQKQIDEHQNTVVQLNEKLSETNGENSMLHSQLDMMTRSRDDLQVQADRLAENVHTIELEKDEQQKKLLKQLQLNRGQLAKNKLEMEQFQSKTNEELTTIRGQLVDSEHQLNLIRKEYELFKSKCEDTELGDDVCNKVDAAKVEAELTLLRQERIDLVEKLKYEESTRFKCEKELKDNLESVQRLEGELGDVEKLRLEAVTKLDVLTAYFKEKEAALQKEITKHESMLVEKEGYTATVAERFKFLQEQLKDSKAQNDLLKQEILNQEVDLKSQISMLEKKAHENWVSARQLERRIEESKQENSTLRNCLTLRERKNLDDASQSHELNGSTLSLPTSSMEAAAPVFPPPLPPPPAPGMPFLPPPPPFLPPPPIDMLPENFPMPPPGGLQHFKAMYASSSRSHSPFYDHHSPHHRHRSRFSEPSDGSDTDVEDTDDENDHRDLSPPLQQMKSTVPGIPPTTRSFVENQVTTYGMVTSPSTDYPQNNQVISDATVLAPNHQPDAVFRLHNNSIQLQDQQQQLHPQEYYQNIVPQQEQQPQNEYYSNNVTVNQQQPYWQNEYYSNGQTTTHSAYQYVNSDGQITQPQVAQNTFINHNINNNNNNDDATSRGYLPQQQQHSEGIQVLPMPSYHYNV